MPLPNDPVKIAIPVKNVNITKGQFRWLVTATLLLAGLSVVTSLAWKASPPDSLTFHFETPRFPGSRVGGTVLFVASIAMLLGSVVATNGLYCFWRFARPLTAVVWVTGLVLQAIAGPVVESGLAVSLHEAAALLAGVILALIYASPASAWFTKRDVR
jgi:hypothetical protein